jgi:O-antigen ligase
MPGPVKPSGASARLLDSRAPTGGDQVAPAGLAQASAAANPLRNIAFGMALGLVFVQFSEIHQLLTYLIHVNTYLLYLFGIPTFLGVALTGGIQRTLRWRPAIYWILFLVWLTAGVPFSSWRGGAIEALRVYVKTDFPMLFVIAGLTITWRECQSMMRVMAAAAVVMTLAARMFQDNSGIYGERMALNFGTVANSNDYAGHLVLILPFLMWVGLTAKSRALRLAAWGGVGYGVLLVVRTASRGALLALIVGALYWLLRGTMRQRIALLAMGPVAAVAMVIFVPRSDLVRIMSFSAADAGASQEALESSMARRYLLEQSVLYTLRHPLFGVGMAQFTNFEGEQSQVLGAHGYWHETHNTYTQVSSECGIPALALYAAAILSTFLLVNRVYRQARERPGCEDIRVAAFCIMLAMAVFCTAIAFLNFAYYFYLPTMTSLAIAVYRAAQDEFASRSSGFVEPDQSPQRSPLPRRTAIPHAAATL